MAMKARAKPRQKYASVEPSAAVAAYRRAVASLQPDAPGHPSSARGQLPAMLSAGPGPAQLKRLQKAANRGPHAHALAQWQRRLNGGGQPEQINDEAVVQRAVVTNGGTFDTTRYDPHYEENVGEENQTSVGADMKLTFMPNNDVQNAGTRIIGLIQTVKSLKLTREGRTVSSTPEDSPNKEAFKLTASEGEEGWGIDKRDKSDAGTVNTNPLYAVESSHDRVSKSLTDTGPSLGFGRHWFQNQPDSPAELYDKPRTVLEFEDQKLEMAFEVAASILRGKLEGAYLGSVSWGWTKEKGSTVVLDPGRIEQISPGTPSVNFMRAAKKWNTWNAGERDGNPVAKVPVTDAAFFLPDLGSEKTVPLLETAAELLRAKELRYEGYDAAEIRLLEYHLRRVEDELGTRKDFTEENINAALKQHYSPEIKKELMNQKDISEL